MADSRDGEYERFLWWRGIERTEDACPLCRGSGVQTYPDSSTWRGGIAGQSCTNGVCDKCWGSGDRNRHGVDLRAWEAERVAEVERRAAALFAASMGAEMRAMSPALLALCDALDRLARGRKPRPMWFYVACDQLAKHLRAMVAATGDEGAKPRG